MASSIDESAPLRWGVLGTGRIFRRNWLAMQESGAAVLAAVASRDMTRASGFVREMQEQAAWPQEPRVHTSYVGLLADDDLEAVYVPLPTGTRKPWVIAAAEAGKHVLCEKPCAISATDLREMITACEHNGVLFMDGVMFMHGGRFPEIAKVLDEGKSVGEVRRISTSFTFRGGERFAEQDIRGDLSLEPAGCLGDLGWYCLRAILWTMKWEMPSRVSGRALARAPETGAIMEFSGELDFSSGTSASFHCSFLAPDQMWFLISGTSGWIRVPDFVLPSADSLLNWEMGDGPVLKGNKPGPSDQAMLFSNFAAAARSGSDTTKWADAALLTQILQDACLHSEMEGRPVVLEKNPGASSRETCYV